MLISAVQRVKGGVIDDTFMELVLDGLVTSSLGDVISALHLHFLGFS